MSKRIRISMSPAQPNIEVAYDLALKVGVPYSATAVTIVINPNIVDYEEQPQSNVQQLMVSLSTEHTRKFSFDLGDNKTHTYTLDDKSYQITLLEIGKQAKQGRDFFYFELEVDEV